MIKYHHELIQGSEEWLQARLGLLTASEMKYAISKKTDKKTGIITYKSPEDDRSVAHLYELVAQRITKHIDPHYMSNDMLRGQEDESYARETYHENYAPVETMGFITNDGLGDFTLGYSPDGLVGDNGLIECKSRRQRFQAETILSGVMPDEFLIQVQTGLLVSDRKWCDFISYSGGMPMATIRVHKDIMVQDAIIKAATIFHQKMDVMLAEYAAKLADKSNRLIPTERRTELEMHA